MVPPGRGWRHFGEFRQTSERETTRWFSSASVPRSIPFDAGAGGKRALRDGASLARSQNKTNTFEELQSPTFSFPQAIAEWNILVYSRGHGINQAAAVCKPSQTRHTGHRSVLWHMHLVLLYMPGIRKNKQSEEKTTRRRLSDTSLMQKERHYVTCSCALASKIIAILRLWFT